MPDDLGVQVWKTLEREQELLTFGPHALEVGAIDAHEEVAGPPCCSNDDHGFGVVDVKLVLDPPRDVEEGWGSEVQITMIFVRHQISSCHVPVVRSFSSCERCCYHL